MQICTCVHQDIFEKVNTGRYRCVYMHLYLQKFFCKFLYVRVQLEARERVCVCAIIDWGIDHDISAAPTWYESVYVCVQVICVCVLLQQRDVRMYMCVHSLYECAQLIWVRASSIFVCLATATWSRFMCVWGDMHAVKVYACQWVFVSRMYSCVCM